MTPHNHGGGVSASTPRGLPEFWNCFFFLLRFNTRDLYMCLGTDDSIDRSLCRYKYVKREGKPAFCCCFVIWISIIVLNIWFCYPRYTSAFAWVTVNVHWLSRTVAKRKPGFSVRLIVYVLKVPINHDLKGFHWVFRREQWQTFDDKPLIVTTWKSYIWPYRTGLSYQLCTLKVLHNHFVDSFPLMIASPLIKDQSLSPLVRSP